MTWALVAGLLAVAVVDSVNPSALVVTTLLLAGRQPYRRAAAYILGIALTYFVLGLAVVLGAADLLTRVVDALARPQVGFAVEAVLGAVLVAVALRRKRERTARTTQPRGSGVVGAFLTGVTVTAVESTTALPYVAALTALVRADVAPALSVLLLALYAAVFVLPPTALVLLHRSAPGRATAAIERLRRLLRRLDTRPVRVLTLVLGVLLLLDAAVYVVRGGDAAF